MDMFLTPLLVVGLFVLGCGLPVAVGIGLVNSAAAKARSNSRLGMFLVALVTILAFVLLSVLTFYLTGGGFGPGTGMACTSFFAAPVALWLAVKKRRDVGQTLRVAYLGIACVLIPVSLLMMPVMALFLGNPCDQLDRETGNSVITALESYNRDHGAYPETVDELTPEYLLAVPQGPCHPPGDLFWSFILNLSLDDNDYYLCKLPNEHLALGIPAAGGGFYQAYDLETKEWNGYDYLDQGCSISS